MRGRSMGEITLKLKNILQRINELAEQRKSVSVPKLIAVSKTKPIEAIVELYKCGQYTFGENYVQELEEKANNEQIKRECPDIRWHYIGHLQRNKCNRIVKIPNLECIQTIDSIQLADSLNNACKNVQLSKPFGNLIVTTTANGE
ncbi:unnamed protein product [Didymodactylos carnosus]|uniref:Alanine racemase N-terminal domain-containing protein n=1 Tax=Didymodactylos carnosus TaxID=1234261 RepID=A0A8S2CKU8_9BILA|nr:unnamed protein product [Didymodactylos carnosus]CAF3503875.1 unnamed protein product [Didymodactylos carnosus]